MRKQGYDCLHLNQYVDEMDIDFKTDFYNPKHTNIAGSKKVTSFLGAYLKEKYQLQETLTKDQKVSWEDACKVWDEEDRKFMEKWKKNVKKITKKKEEITGSIWKPCFIM